jgi:hypothetical protein
MSAFNCYDGVFMEKVWKVHGHGHDHGAPQPQVASDLDFPCDDPQLQSKHLTACWGNQASVLYQAFHGDLAKVATKCDSLKDPGSKEFCFNGLARQIHPLTNGKTDEAFHLCSKAIIGGPWQDYCLITIAGSAFSVGDTANMPFQICNRIREGARTACYQRLFPLIHLYAKGNLERADSFCARMNDPQAAEGCKQYQRNYAAPTATGPVTHESATSALKAALKPGPPLRAASDQSQNYITPYQLPYASPYATPYATPYASPYYTPYASPYLDPYITPYINPYTDPYMSPYTDPYTTPYDTPYNTPYDTPYATPYDTPYDTPYNTPYATPDVTPKPPKPPRP